MYVLIRKLCQVTDKHKNNEVTTLCSFLEKLMMWGLR
jgi:hypothetical protein